MSELATFLRRVWETLETGVSDAQSPARLPVLATGGGARVVVLRGFDMQGKTLTFHTHARSQKVAALLHQPLAEVLVWDAAQNLQIRLSCLVSIEEASDALWAAQSEGARQNYADDPAPGAPIPSPGETIGAPDQSMMRVLSAKVTGVDALSLASVPHRRARFSSPDFTGTWIAP